MIKSWIEAMRLRTLPVSVAGVIAGIGCAIMQNAFSLIPALLCLVFATLAQIASNFGNEYYDFKNGIDKKDVEGYRNEEFTHTAVAALIASGNADCGLGIYSAAKMYDLDFIEICTEEYDMLIDEKAYENEQVQTFLNMIKSEKFKERLKEMGGYEVG